MRTKGQTDAPDCAATDTSSMQRRLPNYCFVCGRWLTADLQNDTPEFEKKCFINSIHLLHPNDSKCKSPDGPCVLDSHFLHGDHALVVLDLMLEYVLSMGADGQGRLWAPDFSMCLDEQWTSWFLGEDGKWKSGGYFREEDRMWVSAFPDADDGIGIDTPINFIKPAYRMFAHRETHFVMWMVDDKYQGTIPPFMRSMEMAEHAHDMRWIVNREKKGYKVAFSHRQLYRFKPRKLKSRTDKRPNG